MSESYENPLCKRYASKKMQQIFSDNSKFSTWRKLWVALAESQKELGLDISDAQIQELKSNIYNINYDVAIEKEREIRHDVMAHIFAYGQQCQAAKPIIHLGATSCYVGDNTDIILMRSALQLVRSMVIETIYRLYNFAKKYSDMPTLAYTHFQAAQPTTVGKRATLWIMDLTMDLDQIDFAISSLKFLGCRGTTGTSASFLSLFNGDHDKVVSLENKIAAKMGFEDIYSVSGQTYTRKIDYIVTSALSSIAQSAYKFSNDIRLLSHLKEVEEPFEDGQVGSSAMAYKRNPMRSERVASISRYIMVSLLNTSLTSSAQWFERTLDDSANRRIVIPEMFLGVDAVLSLYINIIDGLKIYPKIIQRNLERELPFMATENILMHCVSKGGDRQILHEAIRKHSISVADELRNGYEKNDLLDRILSDETFNISLEEIQEIVNVENFIGRAREQTIEYLTDIKKLIDQNSNLLGNEVTIKF